MKTTMIKSETKRVIARMITGMVVAVMVFTLLPAQSYAAPQENATRANNGKMIAQLPTTGISVSAPLQTGTTTVEDMGTGEFLGYQFYISNSFKGAKASTLSGIKNKVREITSGKTTNYAKAKAIHSFVQTHMTYYGHNLNLEGAWEKGKGNCETYALLTSTMLYYAGIPNAYAITRGHIFNLIYCDGRWVPSDSQAIFDGNPSTAYKAIETIAFKSGKLHYIIEGLDGLKLVGIGENYAETDASIVKAGITIPAYIKGYYTNWLNYYPQLTIRGSKGTQAESLVKNNGFQCISYSGNSFTASRTHITVKKTIRSATYFAKGKVKHSCRNCGKATAYRDITKKVLAKPVVSYKAAKKKFNVRYTYRKGATGFQVAYKKAGASKYTTKKFNTKKSVIKTVKRLKKGKYTVKVRAFVKSGSKYAYSKWTPARTVKVK